MSILDRQQTIIQQIEAQIQTDKRLAFRKGVEFVAQQNDLNTTPQLWLNRLVEDLTDEEIDTLLKQ